MTASLKMDVQYYPFELPRSRWAETNYGYDEAKMNLLWLVHPEVDRRHSEYWGGDEVSHSIDEQMSKDIRRILNLPPIEFVRAWNMIDKGGMPMTESWPNNYRSTMWARAKLANARLVKTEDANVFNIDFSRFGRGRGALT